MTRSPQDKAQYITRAGVKLAHALQHFQLLPTGWTCADFGSHAGGFVDCLLQHGAATVYAVDTSYGTLDYKLRQDARVVVLERSNAMHITLPEPVQLVTIDVGWTRQEKVIPNALAQLAPGGMILSLLKPHYEAAAAELRHGKVHDELLPSIVERVIANLRQLPGIASIDSCVSPLAGGKGGNVEYFLRIQ